MIPAFVNPGAGTAEAVTRIVADDPRFRLRDCPPEGMCPAVRAELDAGAGRILVVGGDGTAAAVAAEVAGTGVELAVLPGGTLNHFARDVGIPSDPREALEVAAGPCTRRVDVGYLNDHIFLNTSSLGAYVKLARLRDRYRPRLGYLLALALATLVVGVRLRSFPLTMHVNGATHRHRTPLAFIGVGERDASLSTFGARLRGGGSGLHSIVIEGRARRHLVQIAVASAVRGFWAVARTPRLSSMLVDECRIEVEADAVDVALDGDVHRVSTPLDYRLGREALIVVVPG